MCEFEIRVPTAYRLYLTRLKAADMGFRTTVLVAISAIVAIHHVWLALVVLVPLLLLLAAAYMSWFSTLTKTWVYALNDHGARLIGSPFRPLWNWVDLSWSSRLPLVVTEERWHNLPALTVTTNHYGRCLLVYGPEDADRIHEEVLPKIREWTSASTQ